jgi:hypothetical protein
MQNAGFKAMVAWWDSKASRVFICSAHWKGCKQIIHFETHRTPISGYVLERTQNDSRTFRRRSGSDLINHRPTRKRYGHINYKAMRETGHDANYTKLREGLCYGFCWVLVLRNTATATVPPCGYSTGRECWCFISVMEASAMNKYLDSLAASKCSVYCQLPHRPLLAAVFFLLISSAFVWKMFGDSALDCCWREGDAQKVWIHHLKILRVNFFSNFKSAHYPSIHSINLCSPQTIRI